MDEAIEKLTERANEGDARTQFNLGTIYGEGKIVKQNLSLAHKLFKLAALQGHEGAYRCMIVTAIAEASLPKNKKTDPQDGLALRPEPVKSTEGMSSIAQP